MPLSSRLDLIFYVLLHLLGTLKPLGALQRFILSPLLRVSKLDPYKVFKRITASRAILTPFWTAVIPIMESLTIDQLVIDKAWTDTFNHGPYTSLIMVSYLLDKMGLTHEYLLEEPFTLSLKSGDNKKKNELQAALKAIDAEKIAQPPLSLCWTNPAGRCTSFALRTTDDLTEKGSKVDFWSYDFGSHRVARCKKTTTLMDSASKRGALFLEKGSWVGSTIGEQEWSWCLKDPSDSDSKNGFLDIRSKKVSQKPLLEVLMLSRGF